MPPVTWHMDRRSRPNDDVNQPGRVCAGNMPAGERPVVPTKLHLYPGSGLNVNAELEDEGQVVLELGHDIKPGPDGTDYYAPNQAMIIDLSRPARVSDKRLFHPEPSVRHEASSGRMPSFLRDFGLAQPSRSVPPGHRLRGAFPGHRNVRDGRSRYAPGIFRSEPQIFAGRSRIRT